MCSMPATYVNAHSTDPSVKWCYGCKRTQPLEQFHRQHTSSDGRRTRCKPCERFAKSIRQQTPEYKAWRHDYKAAHPEQWGIYWNIDPTEAIMQEHERRLGWTLER